jgi:hypothetical protein
VISSNSVIPFVSCCLTLSSAAFAVPTTLAHLAH